MNSQEKNMLYITDLPSEVTTAEILEFLSKFKDKIRYFNNMESNQRLKGRPLAIKILFVDYDSANKCRLEMNLRKLRGKSIRIMWDERDTSMRYNINSNLFIKGIPKNTTPREVYEYFLKFGDIFSCKIIEDEFGNHNGYGYITYYNKLDAQKAIDETKNKTIFGTDNFEVTYFQKKNERLINSKELIYNNQKIYVNFLPDKYTKEELTKLCEEYGKVISCDIYKDQINQSFGIVQFSSENEAHEAIEKMDGKEVKGNKLMVKLFQTKFQHKQYLKNSTERMTEQNGNCNLFLKNIPLIAKEEDLKKIFSKYGNVISVRIEKIKREKKEEKGQFELISRGYGYLSFDSSESAKNALEGLNGKYLPGFESWSRTLIITYFKPRDQRMNQDTSSTSIIFFPQKKEGESEKTPDINLSPYFPPLINYPYPPNPYFLPQHYPVYPPFPYRNFNQNNFNRRGRGGHMNFYRGNKNKKNRYDNQIVKNNKVDEESEGPNKIDLTEYNNLKDENDKKDFLGEKIFKAIEESKIAEEYNFDNDIIGKITGMIIELPNPKEIIEIIENQDILNSRIEEAMKLLSKNEN